MAIIAEVGTNHLGSLDLALEHVDEAVKCGVDVVKFQALLPNNVVHKKQPIYGHVEDRVSRYQVDRWKRGALSLADLEKVSNYCDQLNVIFMCTPFCFESLEWVSENCSMIKISSSDSIWVPFVERALGFHKPLVISTGISEQQDLEWLATIMRPTDTILHCISSYPTKVAELALSRYEHLKTQFTCQKGMSDHTEGTSISKVLLASKRPAIFEKHFILSRTLPAGDRFVSIEPNELSDLVSFRNLILEVASTEYVAFASPSLKSSFSRSLYATRNLEAGEPLSAHNSVALRPAVANGLSCNEGKLFGFEDSGIAVRSAVKEGEPILAGNVEYL